ncbi:MAG: TonB-dependent receptor [Bryobacterales bacterium]|nr:TonB-dependent receptor [Bryobacterales bacterium]
MASIFALLCAGALVAQDFRAKLTVTVRDPTGSAIPAAALELKNVSTGELFPAQSNEIGIYTYLFLIPGTYSLRATAAGFKPLQRDNIVLQTFQASGLELEMEVGGVTDSVTVTSEGALLDTESASRGIVVSSQLVRDLPVVNKNPLMLGQYMPGVYMRPLGVYTHPWTLTSQFNINGGLTGLNEFQVDGAPNNARFGVNVYGYTPPNETVQELSIQTNSYDAQYGRTSGGVVNVTTKSGTNEFHADFWSYLQRPGWNANSFQNNAIGAQRTKQRQNQWGLQVAGPLAGLKLIPDNERFKVFYLFAFDKYHTELPNPLNLSYPSMEMRNGDFSKLVNAAGAPITIFDPTTGRADAAGNFIRDPFPGNVIPGNRINPIAKAVGQLMPTPDTVTPGVRYSTQNVRRPNNLHYWEFYNWMARMDFNIGSKNRVFVRPARMLFDEKSLYNAVEGPGKNGGVFSRSNYALLVDWVSTVSPTLVANVRVNASQYGEGWNSAENRGYDLTKLGLSQRFLSQVPDPALFGRWEWSGYTGLGQSENWNNTNTYSVQGSLSKFLGKHSLRGGIDVRQTNYLDYTTANPFYFLSNSSYTRRTWNLAATETDSGDGFATFLLGTPSSGYVDYRVRPWFQSWYAAPWFQDDWKVSKKLTVNFGLRWDLNLPVTEKYNRMNIGFNRSAANPISQMIPAAMLAQYPNFRNLTGAVEFAGVNGNRRGATIRDGNNFQPRIGVAYQITPKLVARGGYGLYFTNFQGNNMMQTLGFSNTTDMVATLDGGRTPVNNLLNNPFPTGVQLPPGSSLGALTYVGRSFAQYNPEYMLPYVHQFSFGFQYLVKKNSVIDVSYVGSRTRGYAAQFDRNLPAWDFAKTCDVREGGNRTQCDALTPNPFQGVAALSGTRLSSSAQLARWDLNRPHPQFDGAITEAGQNLGKLWYNALQLNFTQRFSHGLILNASYVRSRQIEQWGWMDEYRRIPQSFPYGVDHPHVFKVAAAYDLPVGKGRAFLGQAPKAVDLILGGWQVAPAVFIQNGERADYPANAQRLRDVRASDINWDAYEVRGWNKCVLSVDNNGRTTPMSYSVQRFGCSATDFSQYDWIVYPILAGQRLSPAGAGDLRMKPYINTDLAMTKTFAVTERLKLQFRAEAANVMNHFNILTARFNTNPSDPNFGSVFPASTPGLDCPPRVLTLGIKARW